MTRRRISIRHYRCPFGELLLGDFDGALCLCDWRYRKARVRIDKRIQRGLDAECLVRDSELLDEAAAQLDAWFLRERQGFDLPLLTVGTPFQKRVWEALLTIPYGQTRSYGELAGMLGDSGGARAVATANGANALSLIIPCHRVIGANGELAGYAGGLRTKQQLLVMEQGDLFNPRPD